MKKTIRLDGITIERTPDEDGAPGEIGVTAKAEVSYPTGNRGDRRIERLTSGGLWGADGDEAYIREVEQDQLNDLRDHLAVFGVDVSNFWRIAGARD